MPRRRTARIATVIWAFGLGAFAASAAGASTPPADPLAARPDGLRCIDELPLDLRAGQTLLALVDDPSVATSAVTSGEIAGIAPFGSVTPEEIAAIGDLTALAPSGLLVASDEEGGRVQRFRDVLGPLPSAAEQAATMSPAEVEAMYRDYGRQLAASGVTVAFAPVVDVGGGPAIGDRSYGDDPEVVAAFAGAAARGYRMAGVLPVLKHFPGHGAASADTHDRAATTPPLAELRTRDLVPYATLLDDEVAVMVGHLDVPGLTDGAPASLSPAAVTGLLRDELGFDGLVISDALGMGAILQFTSGPDAVVRFLAAGGDLAIIDIADVATMQTAIVHAVATGALDQARVDEAATRVLAAKGFAFRCDADASEPPGSDAPASDPVVTATGSDAPASDPVVTATGPPADPPATAAAPGGDIAHPWSDVVLDAVVAAIRANLPD